jgi:putative ATP-binding cassette transporter
MRNDRKAIVRFFQFSAIAGLSSTYCFYQIMQASADPTQLTRGDGGFWSILQFLLALLVFCIAQLKALGQSGPIVEKAVHGIRNRLVTSLQEVELRDAESVGTARITSALSTDTQVISQSAAPIAFAGQSLMMVLFAVIYLALLSPSAVVLTIIVSAVAGWAYLVHSQVVGDALNAARARAADMQAHVIALVAGFKELKLSTEKAQDARSAAVAASSEATTHKLVAHQALSRDFVLSHLAFFGLLGTIVFLMPWLRSEFSESVSQSVTAVMFLISPLFGVLGAVPQIAIANVSADNLMELERLFESVKTTHGPGTDTAFDGFDEIRLEDVRFRYGGQGQDFGIGPLSLQVRKGELIFITGDNGSGKSTLLKVLAGLYRPMDGRVSVDRQSVWPDRIGSYRALMSAVFADFYLFSRLYGVKDLDREWCRQWLERLQLQDKVQLDGGRFSTVALSTGQRKRLALFAALAEQRPLLILDEWAADQDPTFRKQFYLELLPVIRAEGRTVVAITHDDAYFHLADRRIHVANGMVTS